MTSQTATSLIDPFYFETNRDPLHFEYNCNLLYFVSNTDTTHVDRGESRKVGKQQSESQFHWMRCLDFPWRWNYSGIVGAFERINLTMGES